MKSKVEGLVTYANFNKYLAVDVASLFSNLTVDGKEGNRFPESALAVPCWV